jgi:hypothetical protein
MNDNVPPEDAVVAAVRIDSERGSETVCLKAGQRRRIGRNSAYLRSILFDGESSTTDPKVIKIPVRCLNSPCFDTHALLSFFDIFERQMGHWIPLDLDFRTLLQFCHILRHFQCDPKPLLESEKVQEMRSRLLESDEVQAKERIQIGLMLGWTDVLTRACNDLVYKYNAAPNSVPWDGISDAACEFRSFDYV